MTFMESKVDMGYTQENNVASRRTKVENKQFLFLQKRLRS